MTAFRHGDEAASYLQEVSTPRLYINNAFRITGLEVTTTLKEAKKHIKDIEQCQKLGIPRKAKRRAYFPVCSKQTIEDIQIAVDQKLANPYCRLIEELFWFWPNPGESPEKNEALSLLSEGHQRRARGVWIAQVNSPQANIIALHNLAVLHHLQVVEIEQEIREGGCQNLSCPRCFHYFRIAAEESGKTIDCPRCKSALRIPPLIKYQADEGLTNQLWSVALDYWSRLWISDQFWSELSLRAENIDDIIEPEFIEIIKQKLPESLLSINVELAIEHCKKNNISNAVRHAQAVFSSSFSEKQQFSAIKNTTFRMIEQVHQQAAIAKENASRSSENGMQEALELLDKTRSDLKCFEILDCGSLNLGHTACDAVADSASRGLIYYGNETQDYESILAPMEDILKVVKSESLKDRIYNDFTIIKNNVRQYYLESNIHTISDICQQIILILSKMPESDINQPYSMYTRFRDEAVPNLDEIKIRFGENSEEYREASNRCAYCLRIISIALHNNSNDMTTALGAIHWAISMCKDRELMDILTQDRKTCQENIQNKRSRSSDDFFIKLKAVPGWIKNITITLFVWISIGASLYWISTCNSSSPSRYSASPSPTSRPYSGVSSSKSSGSQSTTPLSSLSQSQSKNTSNRSSRSFSNTLLRQEIESGKATLKQMESQLEDIEIKLKSLDSTAERHKLLGQTDSYNKLVPIYNSTLERYNKLYAEYNRLLVEVNDKVRRYNRGY